MALSKNDLRRIIASVPEPQNDDVGVWVVRVALAVETEVRKDCEPLIRQMLEALTAPVEGEELHALHMRAITAARAWLEGRG